MDILPAVPEIGGGHTDNSKGHADQNQLPVQAGVGDDVRPLRIAKGRDVFQKLRLLGDIGDDVQEVHDRSDTQADAQTAPAQEGRDAKADSRQLQLQKEVGQMQQADFLPVRLLADDDNAGGGKGSSGEGSYGHINAETVSGSINID